MKTYSVKDAFTITRQADILPVFGDSVLALPGRYIAHPRNDGTAIAIAKKDNDYYFVVFPERVNLHDNIVGEIPVFNRIIFKDESLIKDERTAIMIAYKISSQYITTKYLRTVDGRILRANSMEALEIDDESLVLAAGNDKWELVLPGDIVDGHEVFLSDNYADTATGKEKLHASEVLCIKIKNKDVSIRGRTIKSLITKTTRNN